MGKKRPNKPSSGGGALAAFEPQPPGVSRKWDCSVGEDFTSRGLEKSLGIALVGMLRLLKGCPTSWRLRAPSPMESYLRGTAGTPNHRFGVRLRYWMWSLMAGTLQHRNDSRALVIDFFETMAREGHMLGEFMTTSHPQIWYYQAAIARAVAIHFDDERIVELTGQYFRRDYYLLDLVRVGDVPHSGGARPAVESGKPGTQNPLRTVMLALYEGRPSPPLGKGWGNPNVPTNGFWTNTYNAGANVTRELIRDGDDLGGVLRGEKEEPILRDPMFVQRDDHGNLVVDIPEFTKSGPGVLPWVAFIGGEWTTSQEYRKGQQRNWKSPERAPKIAGARLTVVPGASCRPYDMDSDEDDDDEGEVS